MSLTSMLDQAHGGRLFTIVASSVNLDAALTRKLGTTARRRAANASVEDIFRDIRGKLGN